MSSPYNNQEELRGKIKSIIDERNGKVNTNPQVDSILQLLLEDKKQGETLARIDELKRAKRNTYIPANLLYKADRRIEALEASLKEKE